MASYAILVAVEQYHWQLIGPFAAILDAQHWADDRGVRTYSLYPLLDPAEPLPPIEIACSGDLA